jgi:hypothetical protein
LILIKYKGQRIDIESKLMRLRPADEAITYVGHANDFSASLVGSRRAAATFSYIAAMDIKIPLPEQAK